MRMNVLQRQPTDHLCIITRQPCRGGLTLLYTTGWSYHKGNNSEILQYYVWPTIILQSQCNRWTVFYVVLTSLTAKPTVDFFPIISPTILLSRSILFLRTSKYNFKQQTRHIQISNTQRQEKYLKSKPCPQNPHPTLKLKLLFSKNLITFFPPAANFVTYFKVSASKIPRIMQIYC